MPTNNREVGDLVPIELQLADGAINQYPRAYLYDQDSVALLTPTIDLSHDANGNYSGTSYNMPDKTYIKIVYIVYSDAAHNTENIIYERDLEVFYKIAISGDWTTTEKEQIRDALGLDGTKTSSTGGLIQRIKTLIDLIFINTS